MDNSIIFIIDFLICIILLIIFFSLFEKKLLYVIGLILSAAWFAVTSINYGWFIFLLAIPLLILDIIYLVLNIIVLVKCKISKLTQIYYIISSILLIIIPFLGVGMSDEPVYGTMYGMIVLDDNIKLAQFFKILDITLFVILIIFLIAGAITLLIKEKKQRKIQN